MPRDTAEAGGGVEENGFVPQLRIVNGQIVLDEESLHVSARPTETIHLAPTVEEDSGGGVTSASYLNRAPSLPWSQKETEEFLAALQKYGTDFSLIAALFPNRNRRQIKNKFKREEREDPRRMDVLLSGGKRLESSDANRTAQMQAITTITGGIGDGGQVPVTLTGAGAVADPSCAASGHPWPARVVQPLPSRPPLRAAHYVPALTAAASAEPCGPRWRA